MFNRAALARRVFDTIRAARPPRLYLAVDGPRATKPSDTQGCDECHALAEMVDWPCEVYTLFHKQNLGSKIAVPKAISWFFDNEEQGIILEDDCLPSDSFYSYCDELLEKHKRDENVMVIAGTNFNISAMHTNFRYYYSNYSITWGWATWRRAWKNEWPDRIPADASAYGFLRSTDIGSRIMVTIYWWLIAKFARRYNNWDYKWTFACFRKRGLCCIPSANLISNIGFGPDAVNTWNESDKRANLPVYRVLRSIVSPASVAADWRVDKLLEEKCYQIGILANIRLVVVLLFPRLKTLRRRR